MGHRGGFRPCNSLESFKNALDSQTIPIVELDVSQKFIYQVQIWLTKDEHLIVVHGGDSGEINFSHNSSSQTKGFIFEHTLN
jgi:glycerophosphoryl diester phosphodiesterase